MTKHAYKFVKYTIKSRINFKFRECTMLMFLQIYFSCHFVMQNLHSVKYLYIRYKDMSK